jgi:hypothetical protein
MGIKRISVLGRKAREKSNFLLASRGGKMDTIRKLSARKRLMMIGGILLMLGGCGKDQSTGTNQTAPFVSPAFVALGPDTVFRTLMVPHDSVIVQNPYQGQHWQVNYAASKLAIFVGPVEIESTLVTAAGFRNLMSKLYTMPKEVDTISDTAPITDINICEAILYCNELSKAMGRSPYYKNVSWSLWQGQPNFGFGEWKADSSSDGIRLPTRCELDAGYSRGLFSNARQYIMDTLCQISGTNYSCGNDTTYSNRTNVLSWGAWSGGNLDWCSFWSCTGGPPCSWPGIFLRVVKNSPVSNAH